MAVGCILLAGRVGLGEVFIYNAAGELVMTETASGVGVSYAYDAAGNVLSASLSAADFAEGGGPGNALPDWWELYYFGQRGVDPLALDADGVSVLMKFALGLRPGESSLGQLPVAEVDGGELVLIFGRSRHAEGIAFLVEGSADLMGWEGFASLTQAALAAPALGFSEDGEVSYHEVRVPVNDDRFFMRLRVWPE